MILVVLDSADCIVEFYSVPVSLSIRQELAKNLEEHEQELREYPGSIHESSLTAL